MKNFLALRKDAELKRNETEEALNNSHESFAITKISSTKEEIALSLMFPSKEVSSRIKTKGVAGLEIPEVELEVRDIERQAYSLVTTPSELDRAIAGVEEALKKILELSNLEAELYMLATEIEKVRRRVNALEHIFIPRLESAAKYIEMRRDEMELEIIINIMKIKNLTR